MRSIQRFGLFAAVFTLPQLVQERVGTAYGAPCLATMALVYNLMQQLEVPFAIRENLKPARIYAHSYTGGV